jgi:hypothetical protein
MGYKNSTILILFIFNAFLLYNHFYNIKKTDLLINRAITTYFEAYKNKFSNEKVNENLKISENLKLINIKGDTLLAKKVLKKGSLILAYSEFNCRKCINAEIKTLTKISKKYFNKINIIVYSKKIKNLKYDIKELHKLGLNKINVYLLTDNKLGIPIDRLNSPYYFYINSELTVSNIFIPEKETPKITKTYLDLTLKNISNL